jgi:hypothetical protein
MPHTAARQPTPTRGQQCHTQPPASPPQGPRRTSVSMAQARVRLFAVLPAPSRAPNVKRTASLWRNCSRYNTEVLFRVVTVTLTGLGAPAGVSSAQVHPSRASFTTLPQLTVRATQSVADRMTAQRRYGWAYGSQGSAM